MQRRLHPPQWNGSFDVVAQYPLQSVVPAMQAPPESGTTIARQVPPMHVVPPIQRLLHVPQLSRSAERSRQDPEQITCAPGHLGGPLSVVPTSVAPTSVAPTSVAPTSVAWGTSVRSPASAAMSVGAPPSEASHDPALQRAPAAHATVQPPQCAGSSWRL